MERGRGVGEGEGEERTEGTRGLKRQRNRIDFCEIHFNKIGDNLNYPSYYTRTSDLCAPQI